MSARSGDTLRLSADSFVAKPTMFTDTLCGNCQDPRTKVAASFGFRVANKALVIIGASRGKTRLVTNAGYGLFFDNAGSSALFNLTVTGGMRDADGSATDAGIVVRNSRVTVEQCDIRENKRRIDSVIVGIGGVFGREGAELTVSNCNIVGNTWDGIALYRGANAVVSDCLIKDGRGVGIGVTWDANCDAYRNEVTGYWKGIGSFGTSNVTARNNLVHRNLGWGIIATGESSMEATNNVVYHNGNCGVASWGTDARGKFINNVIVDNGWRDQWVCPCVGVWNYGDWSKWVFRNNIIWGNKANQFEGIWDQTEVGGNLSVDPQFADDGTFALKDSSPAIHAGDSTIYNLDGTRSHIGLTGGGRADRK